METSHEYETTSQKLGRSEQETAGRKLALSEKETRKSRLGAFRVLFWGGDTVDREQKRQKEIWHQDGVPNFRLRRLSCACFEISDTSKLGFVFSRSWGSPSFKRRPVDSNMLVMATWASKQSTAFRSSAMELWKYPIHNEVCAKSMPPKSPLTQRNRLGINWFVGEASFCAFGWFFCAFRTKADWKRQDDASRKSPRSYSSKDMIHVFFAVQEFCRSLQDSEERGGRVKQ